MLNNIFYKGISSDRAFIPARRPKGAPLWIPHFSENPAAVEKHGFSEKLIRRNSSQFPDNFRKLEK